MNGGRSPNPAVGGQTLGGGTGWLTNFAGVTAASVTGAEVVLANSTIVNVDEENNSNLMWALKGGGPNFGVVTSFTYKTLPVDKIWFAARLYTSEKNPELLGALLEYQRSGGQDPKASMVFQLSEAKDAALSFVGFMYSDPVEWPSAFSPFYNVTHSSNLINSSIGTLSDLASSFYTPQYPDPGARISRFV